MVVCVECGREVIRLFRDYGNHNIRLKRCEHCGAIADKYIELNTVNIILEMLLLKEPVYRHSIFNRQNYAVNSTKRDSVAEDSLAVFDYRRALLSYCDVARSVLLMGLADIYVKLQTTPGGDKMNVERGNGNHSASGIMERVDVALHDLLFSQVRSLPTVLPSSTLTAWSYLGITTAAIIELLGFLGTITLGVFLIRNRKNKSAMALTPLEIAVAAGMSQIGKVAPVILMIWSATPDIRLAVASFNLSTCVVVVKLTSGRKGTPALMVVLTAVAIRLMTQWTIASLRYPQYPCSIISAFG